MREQAVNETGVVVNVTRLDHFVLTVKSIDDTVNFYTAVMGMEKLVFGGGRVALQFGNQKINLHELGNEYEPMAGNVAAGSADLCFISETPVDDVIDHLASCRVVVIEGPVERTGAMSKLMSVYFRDPDDNLIEVSNAID